MASQMAWATPPIKMSQLDLGNNGHSAVPL
jgi:hypothetical protein